MSGGRSRGTRVNGEPDEINTIVRQFMASVAPGSYLGISHGAAALDADSMTELAKTERAQQRELHLAHP